MKLLASIGNLLLMMFKWILKAVLSVLLLTMEVLRLFLLLVGLVAKVFLIFVRFGTV